MKNAEQLLNNLKKDNPSIKFEQGQDFVWSSAKSTVIYKKLASQEDMWALVHETAHALLGHKDYKSDQHLLTMELEAWNKAKQLAKLYDVNILQDHIENCLDTYRDWLHQRATCPNCNVVSAQMPNRNYKCFNCHSSWQVPDSPLCKIVKRRLVTKQI